MEIETQQGKYLGCSKTSSKREIFSKTGQPQTFFFQKRNPKQFKLTPKGTRK